VSGSGCPACTGDWPRPDHRIAELPLSVLYLNEDQFFPGWTVLVLKRHATELFELTRDERAQLMEEVSAVAQALKVALGALKINYELLGNQIAHIHWHLVPRLAGDPIPKQPPWQLEHEPKRLAPSELTARIGRLAAHVQR
jgi:diadenosine tetraphosphate (Ap4A) HIT family hydrolase